MYQLPEPKKLILFPSYIRHAIEMNQSKKNRKSLAFNFVPVGDYHLWIHHGLKKMHIILNTHDVLKNYN